MTESHNNQNKKNIWKDKRIAPLEYCSITRAAKLLECEAEDFLHWHDISALELLINPKGYLGTMRFYSKRDLDSDNNVLSVKYVDHELDDFIYEELKIDGVMLTYEPTTPIEKKFIENKGEFLYTVTGKLGGLWKILSSESIAQTLGIYRLSNDDYSVSVIMKESLVDKWNDIFITRDDIEKIYNHSISGNPMPTDEIKQSPLDDEDRKIKTSSVQADFIYSLLQLVFIDDGGLAKLSRESLETQITRKFSEKGISYKEFTSKSLENWIKRAKSR